MKRTYSACLAGLFAAGLLLGSAGCASNLPPAKAYGSIKAADMRQFKVGTSTKAEVLAKLGRPVQMVTYRAQAEEVWDYQYLDGNQKMLAQVSFNPSGVYQGHSEALDPAYTSSFGT